MIRRPPRSTLSSSSAASDVYKRQINAEYGEQQTPVHVVPPVGLTANTMWCRGKLDQAHARRHLNLGTDQQHIPPIGLEARCAVSQGGRLLAVGSSSMIAVYELTPTPEPAHCGSDQEVILHPEVPSLSFKAVVAAGEAGISAFRWIDTLAAGGKMVSVLLVGDEDGVIRVHNDGCIILEQRLWRSSVIGIQACNGADGTQPDGVLVLHAGAVVCHLEGSVLFGAIQASLMGQLQLDATLQVSRWHLQGGAITGAFCGRSVCTAAGSSRTDTLAMFAVGSNPAISLHHAVQERAEVNTKAVASNVANKVLSSVSSWLWTQPAAAEAEGASSQEAQFPNPPTASVARSISDTNREIRSMAVDPTATFVASADSLGRVMIVNIAYGTVVRMLKGYRMGQCSWTATLDDNGKLQRHLVILLPDKGIIEAWKAPFGERVLQLRVGSGCALLDRGSTLAGLLSGRDWAEDSKAYIVHARGHVLEFQPSKCLQPLQRVEPEHDGDVAASDVTSLPELLRALEGAASEAAAMKLLRRIEQTQGPTVLSVPAEHLGPLGLSLGKAVHSISESAALQGSATQLPQRLNRLLPVLSAFKELQAAPAVQRAEEDAEPQEDSECSDSEWSEEEEEEQGLQECECTLSRFMSGMVDLLSESPSFEGDTLCAVNALFSPVTQQSFDQISTAISLLTPQACRSDWLEKALSKWLLKTPRALLEHLQQLVHVLKPFLSGCAVLLEQISHFKDLLRVQAVCRAVVQAFGEDAAEYELAERRCTDLRVLRRCWKALRMDCSELCLDKAMRESISSLVARAQLRMSELQLEAEQHAADAEGHVEAATEEAQTEAVVGLAEMLTHFAYCTSSDVLAAHRTWLLIQKWEGAHDDVLIDSAKSHLQTITSSVWRHTVACAIFWDKMAPILKRALASLETETPHLEGLSGCRLWIGCLREQRELTDNSISVQDVGVSENELAIWTVRDDPLFQSGQAVLRQRQLPSSSEAVALTVLVYSLETSCTPSITQSLPLQFPQSMVQLVHQGSCNAGPELLHAPEYLSLIHI
eukprot:TRINITY_DN9967_c0_g1_i6.p1 TRINITY_DN9967_c0_g1~~TRINITY_DN9967_c0_g1_i6.p1  ORF type:complete len:1044 (+),score=271.03 TRINITY_DN9967_c0_g1_i6:110-3241(+)